VILEELFRWWVSRIDRILRRDMALLFLIRYVSSYGSLPDTIDWRLDNGGHMIDGSERRDETWRLESSSRNGDFCARLHSFPPPPGVHFRRVGERKTDGSLENSRLPAMHIPIFTYLSTPLGITGYAPPTSSSQGCLSLIPAAIRIHHQLYQMHLLCIYRSRDVHESLFLLWDRNRYARRADAVCSVEACSYRCTVRSSSPEEWWRWR